MRNVVFLEADAETYAFEPIHDFRFSRFGMKFFEDPVAGLGNMHASLRPGGTMTMIGRELAENPWLSIPRMSLSASCRGRAKMVIVHLTNPASVKDGPHRRIVWFVPFHLSWLASYFHKDYVSFSTWRICHERTR